jgi:hypothetical protein
MQCMERFKGREACHSVDRMRAAHRIVKAARRRGDNALELDAWDHFIAAM